MVCRNPSLSADGTWTPIYWPIHSPTKREVLELNANVSRVLEGHRVKKCAFWKKFLPRLLSLSKFQNIHTHIYLSAKQLGVSTNSRLLFENHTKTKFTELVQCWSLKMNEVSMQILKKFTGNTTQLSKLVYFEEYQIN